MLIPKILSVLYCTVLLIHEHVHSAVTDLINIKANLESQLVQNQCQKETLRMRDICYGDEQLPHATHKSQHHRCTDLNDTLDLSKLIWILLLS